MRRESFFLIIVNACCLFCNTGCTPAPTATSAAIPAAGTRAGSAASAARAPATSRDAAVELRQSKSLASLTTLLRMNDDPAKGLIRIGSAMKFGVSTEGFVTDVGAVESQGHSFLIAMALAEVDVGTGWTAGSPKPQPVPVVFLFDDEGRLMRCFGSRSAQNLDLSQSIIVTSFGTRDAWFVWVIRFDPADQSMRLSDIYLVGDNVRKVLSVHHKHHVPSYTNSESARDGVFLYFSSPTSGAAPGAMQTDGVARDGATRPARLEWDPEKHAFRGPSKIAVEGDLVYEVDVGESEGFEATDLSNGK